MKRKKATQNLQVCKKSKNDFTIGLKELIANPGHSCIVRNISSFLDAKSLAQCRLVSQSWKDLIDNNRPWLVFQLEHIHTKEKTFVDQEAEDKPSVKTTIKERFSEWYKFIQQISRKQSIPRLTEIVRQMWIYMNDQIYDDNPLHSAISKSDTQYVQVLVDCGIDLTMTAQDNGRTPMHYACRFGSKEMVKLLFKHLPTFDSTSRNDYGQTIFHLAVRNQDPQVLKLILDRFRFEDIRDSNGKTIFHLAVYNPDPQVPKLILDMFKYEDVRDNKGGTMIHHAVVGGPKETIQFLLESRQKIGFNLEARSEEGLTILHYACWKRDIEIVDLVFKALEEINSEIDFDTRQNVQATPLHAACMNPKSDVAIQLLQRFPQKINTSEPFGRHILHIACKFGHLELLKYITLTSSFEVDFNVVDVVDQTPLHLASWIGHFEIVNFLFQNYEAKDIDVTKKTNYGYTAEDLARQHGHQNILELLEMWERKSRKSRKSKLIKKT